MKFFVVMTTLLVASVSFAGGSGGGGGGDRPTPMMRMMNPNQFETLAGSGGLRPDWSPEILFHMGQNNGQVKFAYGKLQGNQWQIQNGQMALTDLKLAPEALSALETSKATKDWVFIK